jgi:hypothetical protein
MQFARECVRFLSPLHHLDQANFAGLSHAIRLLKCTFDAVLQIYGASLGTKDLLQPLVARPRSPCQCTIVSYVGWGAHGRSAVHHVRPAVQWGHNGILAMALAAQAFSKGMGLWTTFSPSPLCLLCSNKGGSQKQLLCPALSWGTQKVDAHSLMVEPRCSLPAVALNGLPPSQTVPQPCSR